MYVGAAEGHSSRAERLGKLLPQPREALMDYNAGKNSADCYELAITYLRLKGIKEGKFEPRPDCPAEMAAARGLDPCSMLTQQGFVSPTKS